jgi:hypothetical protein
MDDATSGLNIEGLPAYFGGWPTPSKANDAQLQSYILGLLGVPSYADLTAGNAALASGTLFFNVALAKLDQATA